ncbi:hypothetical protein PoB_007347800 [Plakobranchus ocellatus]|uniref:Uncharacterized protein n=1 Tax=Plakobranchus ocellatus TaxID=259542 RepID=A0AAV4DSB5_9GAST|nr:hypothetical protein PoB_007347800 [Plakobranchus ocellatus]
MIGTNGADWRTAHPGCALQTFDSEGARQGKLDLIWLQVSDFQQLVDHSSFFPGAHWVEERMTKEKRIDNIQKQAETFGGRQALTHDWDKWSRVENSSPRLCPADF